MKDKNQIDELFREAIMPYELSPSDKVWESIDKKLDAKAAPSSNKVSNAGRLFLVAAASVVVSTALVVAYYNTSEKKNVNTATEPVLKKETVQKEVSTANNTFVNNTASGSVPEKSENKTIAPVTSAANKSTSAAESEKVTAPAVVANQNTATGAVNDAPNKTEPITPHLYNNKNNADKSVLLLPYFSSDYKQSSSTSTNSNIANTPIAPTKNDPVENQTKPDHTKNIMFVPNAFTPNGDGLNDVFMPQTNESFKEYKLYIFDRLGNTVFVSDDVQNGWDGHTQVNGAETVKEDIYMWRIEIKNNKGEKEHMMGNLTLIK
jgi:gliding motility-associated-like protein